jgi:mRNA-degrading endonuclease toxin of MazEF toxin-antitoxin module
VANLDNITALPTSALVQRAGVLTSDELTALCSAARFAIGC